MPRPEKGFFRAQVVEFALDQDVNEEIERGLAAIRAEPGESLHYVKLGDLYYSQRRPEEAVRYYARALEINPRESRTHIRLGQICVVLGLYDEAWECARAAESLGDHSFKQQLIRNGLPEPS